MNQICQGINIQAQYFAAVPMRHFEWIGEEWCDDHVWQHTTLEETIRHPLSRLYPPTLGYQKVFLKTLIQKLEEQHHEVSEELYSEYIGMLNEPNGDQKCYKTYFVNSTERITLKESTELISKGTTGLRTWEAAFALAEWCVAHKEHLHGRNIIELGCGTGLTGLVVVRVCCPTMYCFTDIHSAVLDQVQENISVNSALLNDSKCSEENSIEGSEKEITDAISGDHQKLRKVIVGSTAVTLEALDWGRSSFPLLKDFNILLAADVVYDVSIIPDLVRVLCHFLEYSTLRTAYVACTVRNEDTLKNFLVALDKALINYEEMTEAVPQIFYYERSVPVKLWKLRKLDSRSGTR